MGIYIPDIKLLKDEPGAFQVIVLYVGADGKLRAECDGTHEVTVIPAHGRLGDLDALKVSLAFAEKTSGWAVPMLRAVLMVIDEMPTIIPAEPLNEEVNE